MAQPEKANRGDRNVDWKIAKAIGLQVYRGVESTFVLVPLLEWRKLLGASAPSPMVDDECVLFQPSVDLNAAFAVAEKAGLFDSETHDAILGKNAAGRWEVLWGVDDEEACCAPTPALAICGAILKLKQETGKRDPSATEE